MKFKKLLSFLVLIALLLPQLTFAQIELNELALPTETKDIGKNSGSIYYSTTNKNKALMPVHFWGEVGRSGLHYIPVDTKLIKGISFAGGGSNTADLEEVIVNRSENGKIVRREFNLAEGGDIKAHEFSLQPGDTVFIPRDDFRENRAYYTSLVGVIVSVLTSYILYNRIQNL